MILVIIPESGKRPKFVAFANEDDFIMFAREYKSDYSVQYILDGSELDDVVVNKPGTCERVSKNS